MPTRNINLWFHHTGVVKMILVTLLMHMIPG